MKLSKIQLDEVQGLQGEFNKAKLSLGDITFQQSLMVKQLEQFQVKFAELEAKLINAERENKLPKIIIPVHFIKILS